MVTLVLGLNPTKMTIYIYIGKYINTETQSDERCSSELRSEMKHIDRQTIPVAKATVVLN